jgi:ATP-dependent RNA helicase DeaD
MDKFRKIGISEPIIKVIEEEKFSEPSEIQEKAIPLILQGHDVIAGAATGSGKTLAFGAKIIESSEKGKGIQALVLTPTRELAEQVSQALRKFSKYKSLEIADVYGGVSINPQIDELKTADVVVGTPGRILDHLDRRTINLENLKILVLDEADRMLDMGFIDDVTKIISECPGKRQTLMFSATISHDIVYLSRKFTKNPVEVEAESYVDPKMLTQFYYETPDNLKFSLLVHLLSHEKSGLVMVFCNTRRNVDFVAKNLKFAGINALAIHGGFSQDKRSRVMDSFHTKQVYVLVCTDVAARGLDIKGVSHVYNYDIPKDSSEYIHRIGRTARAGKEGKAISILASRDFDNFRKVLKNPDLDIVKEEMPMIDRVRIRWMESPERDFDRRHDEYRHRQNKRQFGRR